MILRDSRYEPVKVFQDGRQLFVGTRLPVQLDPSDDDSFVAIGAGERIDQFAYRVWGNELGEAAALLWWILCDLNDIVNPFTIRGGTKFRVPTTDRVVLEVFQ